MDFALRERMDDDAKKLAALRQDIAVGMEQSRLGQSSTFDQAVVDEIKTKGRERLAAKRGALREQKEASPAD